MPIYEYKCQDCGTTFEAIVPSQDADVACRKCESPRLEKQFSTFAVAGAGSANGASYEASPGCGTCGAARPGMCQMN